jgi:Flp pilus assembly pilin Flp
MSVMIWNWIAARGWRDQAGQDLVEYALLVGLVAVVAAAAVSSLGATVKNVLWGAIASAMP